jgi:polysaccharide export outer membrane protein
MSRTILYLVGGALAAGSLLLPAQTNRPATPLGPMGDAGQANLPGQRIGPNDLLAISVYDAPEFTRTVRVSAEGFIRLPMVGDALKAEGLLPSELETAIAGTLVTEGLFVKPVVMVTIAEYASRPISVMGAVKKPITFQAMGRVTILDALARAEGLATEAGPFLVFTQYRKDSEGKESRIVTRIELRELIDQAKPELNALLTGGEEIRVPEARKIFVTGNVKKPGAYPVRDAQGLTVLKAVALAEGVSPFPQRYAYIYRPDESGQGKKEIQVEFAKIIERKAVDIALEPDDVLYIPEDRMKKNAFTATEKVVTFGIATVSGMLIWRGR